MQIEGITEVNELQNLQKLEKLLSRIPRVGVAQLPNVADTGEVRRRELNRRSARSRRVEKPRMSGGDSAGSDRRSSGEEVHRRAKFVERVGFDDIHPQICRDVI